MERKPAYTSSSLRKYLKNFDSSGRYLGEGKPPKMPDSVSLEVEKRKKKLKGLKNVEKENRKDIQTNILIKKLNNIKKKNK